MAAPGASTVPAPKPLIEVPGKAFQSHDGSMISTIPVDKFVSKAWDAARKRRFPSFPTELHGFWAVL
jgi:hypothetical protein